MPRTTSNRKYGRFATTKATAAQQFSELRQSPPEPLKAAQDNDDDDAVGRLTEKLEKATIEDAPPPKTPHTCTTQASTTPDSTASEHADPDATDDGLRTLRWDDVCPFGDGIEKIAEASYAEVYRISNDRGMSIIKVIRLESPLKPQTKTQKRAGLVDEDAHSEDDLRGELLISEWLADIPGFVVYKECYVVQGKAPKALLETHQAFHRRAKRKDPDRLQFYPSPGRYLHGTKFLVVELGDAGTALEDFELTSADQLWDIFLHTSVALARAEDLIKFEHRDLHEGNLCVRQNKVSCPSREEASSCHLGWSGLNITILDYGLSRAEDAHDASSKPVAYDFEKDLGIFTSTHADQCRVYREMRTFLMKGDRGHLDPKFHTTPYQKDFEGKPISWEGHHPYTNVLWLAYIYRYMVTNFAGSKKELLQFRRPTKELWAHLDPQSPRRILSFSSAVDVVRFAAEAGWITQDQLTGENSRLDMSDLASVVANGSIVESQILEGEDACLRRSPRRLGRLVQ